MTKGNPMHRVFRRTDILFSSILLLSSLARPAPASGAEPADSAKSQAQVALREGNVALEQGRAEEALAKFTEAYRLFPSPKIHYNLGQAHSLIPRHEAQAYEEMSRFLLEARDADASLRGAAETVRAQLRPKVGMVSVLAQPADADLVIDGFDVGPPSPGMPAVLGIGTHHLSITKAGLASSTQMVTIAGGDAMEVPLHLLSLMPPPPPLAGTSGEQPASLLQQTANTPAKLGFWTWQRELGAGLAVLGAASLLLGIAEHVSYFGKANDFKNAGCGTSNLAAGASCKSLNDQFNSARTWLVVGYVGAAVLGGAGAYFLWLAPAEGTGSGGGLASVSSGMTVNFQGRL